MATTIATGSVGGIVSPQAVTFVSFSALAVQAWDLIVHLGDEVEYIWRGKFTLIKVVYFTARYVILAGHCIDQVLTSHHEKRMYQASRICPAIYIYKSIVAVLALKMFEMVLFLQGYTYNHRSFNAKRLLFIVFSLTSTIQTIGLVLIIRKLSKSTICAPQKSSNSGMAILAIGAGVFQLAILSTTVARNMAEGQPASQYKSPTSSIPMEGELATGALLVSSISLLLYECSREDKIGVSNAAYAWFLACLSIAATRLILEMAKVAAADLPPEDPHAHDEASIPLVPLSDPTQDQQ
ncbi:hypothetical protein D9613_011760 [Agrocybe pediades]|uniref:DUF6533 domain-containing protein n=1 Tax=Agrocybe pediades TaxID=84607 RepID=A0A8H4QKZ2_9AGAR|nr:hypothetical protein D9613_011760 [Agrocybe pediades]